MFSCPSPFWKHLEHTSCKLFTPYLHKDLNKHSLHETRSYFYPFLQNFPGINSASFYNSIARYPVVILHFLSSKEQKLTLAELNKKEIKKCCIATIISKKKKKKGGGNIKLRMWTWAKEPKLTETKLLFSNGLVGMTVQPLLDTGLCRYHIHYGQHRWESAALQLLPLLPLDLVYHWSYWQSEFSLLQ